MLMNTKFPPYVPPRGEPGHDGNPPEFVPARDIHSRDRMTGKTIREVPDGPENVNNTRVRYMHSRGRLSDRQAEAARRYQSDWEASEMLTAASATMVRV